MLKKIKENIGLVATAIALMGSVGAGIQSLTAVVNTLQGIDERMNNIEYEFQTLKESTYVQNDIAVLYEKVQQLEMTANDAEFLRDKLSALEANYFNLEQQMRDSGYDFQNKYIPEKWEWQDLNDSITRVETQSQTISQSLWEIDDLKNRIAYLEAFIHSH
tara:strand:+ start:971 stop:1453 length:483 start_codon:yes stop_codon:yes gene_type:complete